MAAAQKEMTKIVACCRIQTPLRRSFPAATDNDLKICDDVLMFCKKLAGKWVGTYVVEHKKNKALLLDPEDRLISASIDMMKLYLQRDPSTQNNPGNAPLTVVNGSVNESTEQFGDLINNISDGNTNTS